MNKSREGLITILKARDWKEPAKEEFLIQNPRNVARRTHRLGYLKPTVWYEDIHYVWRNYKPSGA